MVEKILDQQAIDALVRAARGKPAETKARHKKVTEWDARQSGQIGREQMQAISTLHEGFARNLTNSLGAYLRVAFQTALTSAEHLTYVEFMQRIPELTYLASIRLEPAASTGLLQMDLSAAFPLIDVLLGGDGKGDLPTREVTEIEEQILETVVRIICRELQTAWQVMVLEFQFEQRQQPKQVQHLMPEEEKTLSLSFEITVAESRGTMTLVVPAVVSNALLRKLSLGWVIARPRTRPDVADRLRAALLVCPFELQLSMNSGAIPMQELLDLVPGDLLQLRRRVDEHAVLLADERKLFSAAAVRCGPQRAAQLFTRLVTPGEEKKQQEQSA